MSRSLDHLLRRAFVAAATPMLNNGDLDHAGLAANVRWFHDQGLGVLLLGSTGEQVHLSEFERALVLEAGRRFLPAEGVLLAGTGMPSTRLTVAECRNAGNAGADAALVVTPSYYQRAMGEAALIDHYQTVADASPIPVLLYSVPGITGVTIPATVVAALAPHPNVAGMKNSGTDAALAAAYRDSAQGKAFIILGGSPQAAPAFLHAGWIEGVILAVANIAPEATRALLEAARQGDVAQVDEQGARLRRLTAAVGTYGIGGWKAGLEARGQAGGPPRAPLRSLSPGARDEVAAAVRAHLAEVETLLVNEA